MGKWVHRWPVSRGIIHIGPRPYGSGSTGSGVTCLSAWTPLTCTTGSLLTREKCERIRVEEGEKQMTKRIEVTRAPAPLEEYIQHFDPVFGKSNQREGFRQYLEGLLLPSERHKTLTGLVNTEPVVGAQLPRAQKLQWFLSEADWDERKR